MAERGSRKSEVGTRNISRCSSSIRYNKTMHPPSRARRILKWTGVGTCILILIEWAGSVRIALLWGDYRYLRICAGEICVGWMFCPQGHSHPNILPIKAWPIPRIGKLSDQGPLDWKYWKQILRVCFGFEFPRFNDYRDNAGGYHCAVTMPFWLLLLLTAIPTAWLWHRDRRLISSSPDHQLCSGCGYDLTGNLSGVCPECGEKLTTVAQAPSRQGRG